MSRTSLHIAVKPHIATMLQELADADDRSRTYILERLVSKEWERRQHPRTLVDTPKVYEAGTTYPAEEPGTPPYNEGCESGHA